MQTKLPSARMQIQPLKITKYVGMGNYIASSCSSDCSGRNGFIYPKEKETELEVIYEELYNPFGRTVFYNLSCL